MLFYHLRHAPTFVNIPISRRPVANVRVTVFKGSPDDLDISPEEAEQLKTRLAAAKSRNTYFQIQGDRK